MPDTTSPPATTPPPRVALITGASAGIGRATALELAQAGVRVALNARRAPVLDQLAEEINSAGGTARAFPADAADPDTLDRLWQQVCDWAGPDRACPDIVVANAGHGLAGGVLSSDTDRWHHMFQLNVLGNLHLLRLAAAAMAPDASDDDAPPRDGWDAPRDLVVLGSVVGTHISPFSAVYGSTKFALESCAEALRREVGKRGVRVTTVKPGIVLSEFQDVAGYDQDNFGHAVAKFGRVLEPADIARSIRFVVEQPPHVHVNTLTVRPTGQDYP